ncbi:DUF6052 family protein [Streptomyces sp. NPDC053048]|uniref:DUF6052 family protein n=1 Tax=Streptomyces sp. NPDC053048 TaxID=3365694 RepID=UPI0037D5027E
MTNERAEPAGLTPEQERVLLDAYTALGGLARSCEVPAVTAAVGAALAELRVALDGQAVDFDFFAPSPAGRS